MLVLAITRCVSWPVVATCELRCGTRYQFFLQFLFWAFLFCAWSISTLLGFVVLPRNREDLDIMKVVVIALCVKHHTTEFNYQKLTTA